MKKSEFLRFRIDIGTYRLLMKRCKDQGISVSQMLRKLLVRELAQYPAASAAEMSKHMPPAVDPANLSASAQVLASLLFGNSPMAVDASENSFTETVEILERLLQLLLSREDPQWASRILSSERNSGVAIF